MMSVEKHSQKNCDGIVNPHFEPSASSDFHDPGETNRFVAIHNFLAQQKYAPIRVKRLASFRPIVDVVKSVVFEFRSHLFWVWILRQDGAVDGGIADYLSCRDFRMFHYRCCSTDPDAPLATARAVSLPWKHLWWRCLLLYVPESHIDEFLVCVRTNWNVAAGLLHMLPDAVADFPGGSAYPFAYLTAGLSYLLLLSIEHGLVPTLGRCCRPAEHSHSHGIRDDSESKPGATEFSALMPAAEAAAGEHSHAGSLNWASAHSAVAYCVLLALCIHSFLAGLALGVDSSLGGAVVTFVAIIAHKASLSPNVNRNAC
jgi:hypothetical protein